MKRQFRIYLFTLGFALSATSNPLGGGPTFTTIDFAGVSFTGATGINESGDIIPGRYFSADSVFHGFLLTSFRQANTCASGN
jgi:hypothetical protein